MLCTQHCCKSWDLFCLIHIFKLLQGESVLTSSNSANLLASSTPADRKKQPLSQQEYICVVYISLTISFFSSYQEDHPFQQELSSCVVAVLESCSGDLCLLLDWKHGFLHMQSTWNATSSITKPEQKKSHAPHFIVRHHLSTCCILPMKPAMAQIWWVQ